MSERDSERAKKDRYELGDVEHISDLAPDPDVGPSRKKHEQKRLLESGSAGYFEVEGGTAGGLGAPLHIGPELKKDGGPIIGEYEAGYNTYTRPLQSTLRALGRIKDVSMTGAPLTPAELKKRPELAARFRRVNSLDGDVMQELAFNQWSAAQTNFQIDIKRFGASQHEMIAVATDFRRVQMLIEQRRAEAKKAQKTSELQKLEQTAKTLANIVEFSLETWSLIGRIETEIARQRTLDERAEGVVSENYPTGDAVNWEHGTIDDPQATNAKVPASKQQQAGKAMDAGAGLATQVRKAIQNRTALTLDLEGVFHVLLGKEHLDSLAAAHKEIELLETQIKSLEMEQELATIRTAAARLKGFKMEFVANQEQVRAGRDASRRGAKSFGASMNAGEQGIMTMYAAEAWHELAEFGALASHQRKSLVDPLVGSVRRYLFSNDPLRYEAIGATQDAQDLLANVHDVRAQRGYFERNLPKWQENARQWGAFLRERTGAPLITEKNEADRRSHGP